MPRLPKSSACPVRCGDAASPAVAAAFPFTICSLAWKCTVRTADVTVSGCAKPAVERSRQVRGKRSRPGPRHATVGRQVRIHPETLALRKTYQQMRGPQPLQIGVIVDPLQAVVHRHQVLVHQHIVRPLQGRGHYQPATPVVDLRQHRRAHRSLGQCLPLFQRLRQGCRRIGPVRGMIPPSCPSGPVGASGAATATSPPNPCTTRGFSGGSVAAVGIAADPAYNRCWPLVRRARTIRTCNA